MTLFEKKIGPSIPQKYKYKTLNRNLSYQIQQYFKV